MQLRSSATSPTTLASFAAGWSRRNLPSQRQKLSRDRLRSCVSVNVVLSGVSISECLSEIPRHDTARRNTPLPEITSPKTEPMAAEDCPEAPAWLDRQLVQEALKGAGDEEARVEGVEVRAAVAPGANFGSALYRVRARLRGGAERALLVKGPPPAPRTAAAIREAGLFAREANMLACVVPKMEALLEAAAPGCFPPFAARCPLHGSSPVDFLVLQDLQPLGFQLAQRKRGLGLRHCLIAMRTLASFHASSVALMASDPHVADGLGSPMITEGPNSMEPFVHACLQQAADACRSWEGFEPYASDLEALKGSLVQKLAALNQPSPGDFNVILHGDFWINNLLFRYEEGLPVDMRMVDFQLSRVASPAVDLLHFLSTSPSENVSDCHEAMLLREYHEALGKALELLGAELSPPPLGALLEAVDAHGACAVLGAAGVMPLVKATCEVDVDAAVGGSTAAGDLYQTSAVRRWLQRVLPKYKKKGWLEA